MNLVGHAKLIEKKVPGQRAVRVDRPYTARSVHRLQRPQARAALALLQHQVEVSGRGCNDKMMMHS